MRVRLILLPQVVDLSRILWDSLLELDDLSASTTCIMDLLCTLLSHNPALFSTHQHQPPQLQLAAGGAGQPTMSMLTTLVPRLWPFLSHTITSVRQSCLKALLTLLHTGQYMYTVELLYRGALKQGHLSNEYTLCGPNGVRNREIPLYYKMLQYFTCTCVYFIYT
jgi:hypothetical protein